MELGDDPEEALVGWNTNGAVLVGGNCGPFDPTAADEKIGRVEESKSLF